MLKCEDIEGFDFENHLGFGSGNSSPYCKPYLNSRKLQLGVRMVSAGSPSISLERNSDKDAPTLYLSALKQSLNFARFVPNQRHDD